MKTLEMLEEERQRNLANPRVAVAWRLVGNARCNGCGEFRPKTTAFDVRKDGSAAILICDACLADVEAVAQLRDLAKAAGKDRDAAKEASRMDLAAAQAHIDRALRAEAQLAALHAAARRYLGRTDDGDGVFCDKLARLQVTLRDTSQAAEAYTRRVRAEALREAAGAWRELESQGETAAWLRARADEIARRRCVPGCEACAASPESAPHYVDHYIAPAENTNYVIPRSTFERAGVVSGEKE